MPLPTDPNNLNPAPGTPGWTPNPSVPSLPTNALGGQDQTGHNFMDTLIPIIGAAIVGAMTSGVGDLTGAGGGAAADAGVAVDTGAAAGAGTTAGAIAPDASLGLGSGADAAASLGASIPADAGIAGGGVASAGGATATLPEMTVTAPSTAGAASGGMGDLLAGVAPIAAQGLSGISGASSAGLPPASAADFSGASASNTQPGVSTDTPNFLQASDTSPSLTPMSGDLMDQLGIDPSSLDSFSYDTSSLGADNPGYGPMDIVSANGQGLSGWLSNPKNLATLGSLGISGLSGMRQPALPAASKTAAANATSITKGALPIIQSGGTAGPQWASQKASIDATIDNEIKQQSAAIQQAAANSGMGNQNSGVVQQQIAAMTQQANLQRQQLYTQVQQQNVQQAITELTGGDALLAQIGNMQLAQEERAQQLAAQTAELALRLYGSSGVPGP